MVDSMGILSTANDIDNRVDELWLAPQERAYMGPTGKLLCIDLRMGRT